MTKPKSKPALVEIAGYGRIPFEDAELPQTLEVLPKDVEGASCSDPRQCVLARAARRNFGKNVEAVIIYRTVAHLVFANPRKKGTYKAKRYAIAKDLQQAVATFDDTKEWTLRPGVYHLLPVPPSQSHGARPNRPYNSGGTGQQKRGQLQAVVRSILGRKGQAA